MVMFSSMKEPVNTCSLQSNQKPGKPDYDNQYVREGIQIASRRNEIRYPHQWLW